MGIMAEGLLKRLEVGFFFFFFYIYALLQDFKSPLQVETTMFAMSTKKHTTSIPPEFDTSSCKQNPVTVTFETYSLLIIII